uniref:Uncharacterized protein n=1 Tax=Avena sativa TaxID=4498 RepID=A0ACD6AJH9_AVESA
MNSTLLLQKEFAQRLVAVPGDSEYNRLAANVRMVADVKLLMDVSKRDFVPMPRVDSSLVEIRPRAVMPDVDLTEWLAFTRECFGQKNKTLGAIFKQKRKILDLCKRSQRTERCTGGATGRGIILGVLDDGNDEACGDDDSSDRAAVLSEEEVGAFKEKIAGAFESTELAAKRPSKMSNDELLRLLRLFNEQGIRTNISFWLAKSSYMDRSCLTDSIQIVNCSEMISHCLKQPGTRMGHDEKLARKRYLQVHICLRVV